MADCGMTFAILNLPIAMISPTKLQFNPTFRLVRDFVWRIWRWLTSLTSEWNEFSILESLCCLCHDNSHKVSVQSSIKLWRGYCLRISRWVLWRPSWKAEWNDYCNSESQCGLDTYHKVFNVTYGSGVDVILTSSGWLSWQSDILNIGKEQF